MKLVTTEDVSTGERILCLRLNPDDLMRLDITHQEKMILNFCDNDGAISSRLLAVALLARRIEINLRKSQVKLS